VIVLGYSMDLSQAQIAERLEWPLGTVKSRTRRAMAQLRMRLGTMADAAEELVPEGAEITGQAPPRRDR
jgi:RNA polymerase sigma-70 factor (ECF subfamily)